MKSASCTKCGAGRYQATNGSAGCADCGRGTFAKDAGASHCELCTEGYFANATGMSSCQLCKHEKGERYTSSSGSSQCDMCIEGYYMDTDGDCVDCRQVVDGADKSFPCVDCSGRGNKLEDLNFQSGCYRFTPSSTTGYLCPFENNCVGGNSAGSTLCKTGAGGPLWCVQLKIRFLQVVPSSKPHAPLINLLSSALFASRTTTCAKRRSNASPAR